MVVAEHEIIPYVYVAFILLHLMILICSKHFSVDSVVHVK